jgi:hypothetical protein|tara:strand:- start:1398 stop:1826 length:429 start_codon:yes stop_codon:yes gene_type:complete
MYINKTTGIVTNELTIPNTSLSKDINLATLDGLDYARVVVTTRPDYKVGRVVTETVAKVSGVYTQQWNIDDSLVDYVSILRLDRDLRLSQSDFTQATDTTQTVTNKAAWATYRQELRDLPANTLDPENVIWPVSPSSIATGE